ncbi:uncharacterized protein KY384_000628 [Bacidia gigantensis]|uniref:uncharacterized protein n=1 Tax=Bacidia gigantensis TaxID=2732470 RepID=UPI001D03FE74|nr:uncharacterized protein KY384_000628 [Bacidia gigantensis]KAG8525868.1 hypothetical protein KY384_000628 [Bacidia gigantensis]
MADGNPMLRDGTTGDWIGTFLGHKGACWQGRLSSDGNLAATASADFTAKVWDTQTGECLHTFQHPHIVRAIALPHHPNPQVLATGGFDKKLMLYEIANSRASSSSSSPEHSTFNKAQNAQKSTPAGYEIGAESHQGAIKSVHWAQDSNTLITACEDKYIRWFDVRTRIPITSVRLDGALGSCELSNTLSTLSVAAGNTAYFFSGSTPGQLLQSVTQPTDIVSVAVHEGERKYATGSNQDTWIRVWDLDAGPAQTELDTWKGHHGPIWSLEFSPDGKACASGSEDGTVKLWKFCEGPHGLWKLG